MPHYPQLHANLPQGSQPRLRYRRDQEGDGSVKGNQSLGGHADLVEKESFLCGQERRARIKLVRSGSRVPLRMGLEFMLL